MADDLDIGQRVRVVIDGDYHVATVEFVTSSGVYVHIRRLGVHRRFRLDEVEAS